MTLDEAIEKVLRENNSFMSVQDIAFKINSNKYYVRKDLINLNANHILVSIENHPSLFLNINGNIHLQENNKFKNLISSYYYIANLIRDNFLDYDIQFINAVLFFYKRLVDINNGTGNKYEIDYFDANKSIINSIDSGFSWIKKIKSLENYFAGLEGAFEECSAMLLKLEKDKTLEISKIISNLDTSSIEDNEFGTIYDFLINSNLNDNSKLYFFNTPESLKTLMVELLNPKENTKIYDPVAGTGGLLIKALKHSNKVLEGTKGTEINNRVAQLGNMNLIVNGFNKYQIDAKNCFKEINENDNKYDYIIANLPINISTNSFEYLELYKKYNLKSPKSVRSFSTFILFILDKLKNDGKAIFTVSEGFLFNQGIEKEIRKILIENDFLETVISLPTGSLISNINVKASLLIINKNKSSSQINKIKFIKAKAINFNKKSILIDNEDVLKSYFNDFEYSKNSQTIQTSNLRNYILSTEAYDDEFVISNLMLKEGSGKLLSDLVQIKAGKLPDKKDLDESGEFALVKIENLSKDILDINISKNINQSVNNPEKYHRNIIEEDCILVARIGDNLKPTIYRYNEFKKPILLHSGVYALIPHKKKNDLILEYLYYQLHSAFILEQIKSKKVGSVMPYITITSLSQLVIPFVSLEFQASFVNTQKANLIATERARLEERSRELGYYEDIQEKELNIVRTITHQLKHQLSGLSTILDKINAISIKNKLGDMKEYDDDDSRLLVKPGFDEPENEFLENVLSKAIKRAENVNNILIDVEKAIILKLEYSELKLFDFFNEIKSEFINKAFRIDISGDNPLVNISKSHFEDLVNTLIENAEEHSFEGIIKPKITFNIKTDLSRGIVVIDYKNNGLPLTISEKEYKSILTKSIKSKGTGIGGYYINKIIEAHMGSLKIIENITTGVHFILELPLKHNENE